MARPSHFFLAAILLLSGCCGCHAINSAAREEDLIGWLGETYEGGANGGNSGGDSNNDSNGGTSKSLGADARLSRLGPAADATGMHIISWSPRIMHYRRFLTEAECDALMADARPRLERSGVSNAVTGASEDNSIRTSSGMFFDRNATALVSRIERRVAAWSLLPPGNQEGLQVLRYEPSEKYGPHHDYFSFKGRDDNGGNRLATVLMYLTDVTSGGETVFPKVPVPEGQTKEGGYSDCAMQGLAVKPKKGDAVLFWSIRPDGTFDPASLHGSCPVIEGEKWSATKWIHVAHYAAPGERRVKVERVIFVPPRAPAPDWCKDHDPDMCAIWAESGECESNPGYMVGTKAQPGACVRSCDRCELVPEDERGGGGGAPPARRLMRRRN